MNAASNMPLWGNVALFAVTTLLIGIGGWRLASVAGRIAERTGLGQAVTGAVFLGATTSLPGSVTSITAASNGFADIAVANALGGIAAQTAFLAIADIAYPRANLEHAAASAANIMQGAMLVCMLALILIGMTGPDMTVLDVHPVSLMLPLAYVGGLQLVSHAYSKPMWLPRQTVETRSEAPQGTRQFRGFSRLWIEFGVLAALVGVAGWLLARSGMALARQTGLSESALGGVFTAVATSLPELVTAIAAVKQGALTLAVGDIIGGNVFDTLFVAVSDVAYRSGSILHAVSLHQAFLVSVGLLQTGVLLMGLVRREKRGIANIGFESFLVLLIYAIAVLVTLTR
ncbi:sodium:calcium antiporter [Azoarcus sp. L1K30]|uniref:sodium:calcium antiporter n=1 Tax=Azoarcus sp. L1K30 TaxID=2820277 RepID=UPI001B841708|nr:sodium:calcium antiporter [Azoarcus sp. L1K30]MBR0565512.1 sodium:calcium antiporter [Azoarcus sp. L1K30]